jgi:hypothetical protein
MRSRRLPGIFQRTLKDARIFDTIPQESSPQMIPGFVMITLHASHDHVVYQRSCVCRLHVNIEIYVLALHLHTVILNVHHSELHALCELSSLCNVKQHIVNFDQRAEANRKEEQRFDSKGCRGLEKSLKIWNLNYYSFGSIFHPCSIGFHSNQCVDR